MADDKKTLFVKAVDPNRVGLWDRSPAHPGGEVWVTGDEVVEVADTTEVRAALTEKRIVEVSGPQAAVAEPGAEAEPRSEKQRTTAGR